MSVWCLRRSALAEASIAGETWGYERWTPLLLLLALGTLPVVFPADCFPPMEGRPGRLPLRGTAVPVRLPVCCFGGIGEGRGFRDQLIWAGERSISTARQSVVFPGARQGEMVVARGVRETC